MTWCGHHFLLRQLFSKACPYMIYEDFPILQKGCHNIHCEYRNTYQYTLSKWINVSIMLWRCFLATFCGNTVGTFLKLSWNMLQKLNLPTFSQLSPNVVEILLQPYIVSWDVILFHPTPGIPRLIYIDSIPERKSMTKFEVNHVLNKAIRDGKYLAPPHASAWQRSPH